MNEEKIKSALADIIAKSIGEYIVPGGDIRKAADALYEQVKPKPLVWDELEQDRGDGTTDLTGDHEAETAFGVYSIELGWGSDSYYWSFALNCDEIDNSFDTLEAAQSAAQSHADAAHWANTALADMIGGAE